MEKRKEKKEKKDKEKEEEEKQEAAAAAVSDGKSRWVPTESEMHKTSYVFAEKNRVKGHSPPGFD